MTITELINSLNDMGLDTTMISDSTQDSTQLRVSLPTALDERDYALEIPVNAQTFFNVYMDADLEFNLEDKDLKHLQKVIQQYLDTPLDERDFHQQYYLIPLPELFTSDGEKQYLTSDGTNFFASRLNKNLCQCFTKTALEEMVPEVYREYAEPLTDQYEASDSHKDDEDDDPFGMKEELNDANKVNEAGKKFNDSYVKFMNKDTGEVLFEGTLEDFMDRI